jgi:hypothetical protein
MVLGLKGAAVYNFQISRSANRSEITLLPRDALGRGLKTGKGILASLSSHKLAPKEGVTLFGASYWQRVGCK